MANGDLSMPIDCACKKFTVRTARRSYIGAALGTDSGDFIRRIFFLKYHRQSPGGVYEARFAPIVALPDEDYTIEWSTECATYGKSVKTGTEYNGGRGGASGAHHLLVGQITDTGDYVFARPAQNPPPGALDPVPPFVLESFIPGPKLTITIKEPFYPWDTSTAPFRRVFDGRFFVDEYSEHFNEAKMQEVLERDLNSPIACAYSGSRVVNTIHNAPAMEAVYPDSFGQVGQPAIGGVVSKDDAYQFLPPINVLHSEEDPEDGGSAVLIVSGHAGRFITAQQFPANPSLLTRYRPPENWLAKAFIYWPGKHALQEHEFGFRYNFGIGSFGDPPDTPDDLPAPRRCEDLTIACPRLIDGYEVEPPETNGRIFWLENYSCQG